MGPVSALPLDFKPSFALRLGVLSLLHGAAARGVLDHAFEGAPQHRSVNGVWLEFQRPQDTAADRGYVCVAAPTSDGKPIRYLDEKPGVLCRIAIGGVTHR